MDKKVVANLLEEIAFLLEFHGENAFKVRAFLNAARALSAEPESLETLIAEPGRLEQVKGIGKSIAAVIREFAETGRSSELEELRSRAPHGFDDLIKVPGLGPKKLRALVDRFEIETLDDLERVCRTGEAAKLPGFGLKTVEKILAGIEQVRRFTGQWLFPQAWRSALFLVECLRGAEGVKRLEIAGSLRRRKEVIRDIDILAVVEKSEPVVQAFVQNPLVQEVIAQGETKVSVRLESGLQVDLRLVDEQAFPAALQYFTGSKEHNTALRARARRLGLKLNEYGLFRELSNETKAGTEERLVVHNEDELYRALGLSYIPPELRENMGEIEAAEKGELPKLIELEDYRGTLHCHTNWSDGVETLETLAREAAEMWRLEYLAVCDHSQSATYAHGLELERLKEQGRAIDLWNKKETLRLLKGCEVDILSDGSLDYPDEMLAELEVVVVSVHSHFQMSAEEMTERICRALRNPYADILGHVSGRLLLMREGYPLDLDKVLDVAAECKTIIEINGDPHRLDLDWRYCRAAKSRGLRFAVNPDAHSREGLRNIEYGLNTARKGWLTAMDVVNCLPPEALLELIRQNRMHRLKLRRIAR